MSRLGERGAGVVRPHRPGAGTGPHQRPPVPAPPLGRPRGAAQVLELLVEHEPRVELAERVLRHHPPRPRRRERDRERRVGPHAAGAEVTLGVQHLLGGLRQPPDHRVGVAGERRGARQLGAAQVREQQALAHHERRLGQLGGAVGVVADELAHALPPAGHARPEVGAAAELRPRRLPLERGLRGGGAVGLAARAQQRVEVAVLVLQRVHQLVTQRGRRGRRVHALHHVERLRARVVVAGHLLAEQPGEERAVVGRVGNGAEALVGHPLRRDVLARPRLVEHAGDEGAHLRAAAHLDLGRRGEAQARGALDLGGDRHGLLDHRAPVGGGGAAVARGGHRGHGGDR